MYPSWLRQIYTIPLVWYVEFLCMSKWRFIQFQVYKFCHLAHAIVFAFTPLAFTSSGWRLILVTLRWRDFVLAHSEHAQPTCRASWNAWSSLCSRTGRNLVAKHPSSFHTPYEKTEVCSAMRQLPMVAVCRSCTLWLPTFPYLLSPLPYSFFPEMIPQINYVHSNPSFGISSWEPKLQLLFKTCLQ